jgi:hypothetical protein
MSHWNVTDHIFSVPFGKSKNYVLNDIFFDLSVVLAKMTFARNNDIFNRPFALRQNYVLNHIFSTFRICGLSDVYSFMLLTPHLTKNIGADNTEQANTNTMAATVWIQRGAMWKRRNSHSSGSYDDDNPICGICWVCNQFTDGCKPITMSNVLMGECTADYHKNLQQAIDPTK